MGIDDQPIEDEYDLVDRISRKDILDLNVRDFQTINPTGRPHWKGERATLLHRAAEKLHTWHAQNENKYQSIAELIYVVETANLAAVLRDPEKALAVYHLTREGLPSNGQRRHDPPGMLPLLSKADHEKTARWRQLDTLQEQDCTDSALLSLDVPHERKRNRQYS